MFFFYMDRKHMRIAKWRVWQKIKKYKNSVAKACVDGVIILVVDTSSLQVSFGV